MLSLFATFLKQKNQQQQHLTDIPDEIILKIFRYLSIPDLGNWTRVSKRFRNISWDKTLPYGSEMKKNNGKGKDPNLKQLLRYIRNPKISIRRKNEICLAGLKNGLELIHQFLEQFADVVETVVDAVGASAH